jgi:TorA maturation chaperone TorD
MVDSLLHPGLRFVSQIFSYPSAEGAGQPALAGLGAEIEEKGEALLAEMSKIDHLRLETEYVRLFINAMPEVPCPPYGSVYLEGSVMGASTLRVIEIYRKYGMATDELADHIAVECEFLAWLSGLTGENQAARQDYSTLLGHLRQWTDPFFSRVEEHDRIGCYRRGAEIGRTVFHGVQI